MPANLEIFFESLRIGQKGSAISMVHRD